MAGAAKTAPKRTRGSGTVRFKNGAWDILLRPHPGAKPKYYGRKPTRSEAEAELAALIVAREKGELDDCRPEPRPLLTVRDVWELYETKLNTRLAAGSIGSGRKEAIEAVFRCHILPAIGAEPVENITSDVIEAYVAAKRQGVAPVAGRAKAVVSKRTIEHQLRALSQMFDWAAHPERGYAAYNPVRGVKLPAIRESETRPYELDHANAAVRCLQAGTVRRVGEVLFATGARLGEVLGALERSWHTETRTLEVEHTLRRAGGRLTHAEGGKTEAAERSLRLTAELAEVLDAQVADNAQLAAEDERIAVVGGLSPSDAWHPVRRPLFPTGNGQAWNPSNFRNRHWVPAVYAAYAKVMPASERARWLADVPTGMRHAAELLCLGDVTVQAVLAARFEAIDGSSFHYLDADGRQREVEMPAELAASVQQLLAERQPTPTLAPSQQLLVRGNGNRPVGLPAFITQVFEEPFERSELDFDRRIHRARHTYISIVKQDPDVTQKELQMRVGHANEASTARYTHTFRHQQERPADVLGVLRSGLPAAAAADNVEQAAMLLGIPVEMLRAQLSMLRPASDRAA